MTTETGSRRELHKAERFGRGGINHFPHIHTQTFAHDRQLVDQSNVDHAERVLQ